MTKHRSKSLLLYQWHRWVGLFAALSALAFSITGIALNHTDELALDSHYVDSAGLRRWYHFTPSRLEQAFRAGDSWLFSIDGNLYWNDQPLALESSELLGVVQVGKEFAVAFPDKLTVLDSQGQTMDMLDESAGIPNGIKRIGKSADGRIALQSDETQWLADADLLNWKQETGGQIVWDKPDEPNQSLIQNALRDREKRKLDLERLLLDLHSGRFFGKTGVWLADLAALALMFLGISGVLIWLIRLIKQRQHRKRMRRMGKT